MLGVVGELADRRLPETGWARPDVRPVLGDRAERMLVQRAARPRLPAGGTWGALHVLAGLGARARLHALGAALVVLIAVALVKTLDRRSGSSTPIARLPISGRPRSSRRRAYS